MFIALKVFERFDVRPSVARISEPSANSSALGLAFIKRNEPAKFLIYIYLYQYLLNNSQLFAFLIN